MPDEKTQVADVFVPRAWEQWFIERTAELDKFAQSGIVQSDAEFDAIAAGPGKIADMPFWKDLSGDRQILSDTNAIVKNKIASSRDACRIHTDANAWSTTLLAALLAGEEGMDAIKELVGAYWARQDEAMLIASLNGVIASLDAETGDPNLLKIASESTAATDATTCLTGSTFIDAKQKLGDRKDLLTAIAMHSAVEADLMKQSLIDFVPDADGRNALPYFQGLKVVTDDDITNRAGSTTGRVYTSVLFGVGAVARGSAPLTKPVEGGFGTEGVEMSRVPLSSDTVIINRRRHVLHPRGMKWNESSIAEAGGPSNAELAEAAQWTRVYESKNVRMVFVQHNLVSQIPAGS